MLPHRLDLSPLLRTLVASVAVLAAAAPSAHAGTYTVSTCQAPNGLAASTSNWLLTTYSSSLDHAVSTCPAGGLDLSLTPGVVHPKADQMQDMFAAPSNTYITGYTYWRSVRVGAGTHYFYAALEDHGSTETRVATCRGDSCSGLGDPKVGVAPVNRWDRRPPQPLDAIGLYLSCGYYTASDPDCPAATPAAEAILFRADVTLSDTSPPRLQAPPTGGLLSTSQTLSGVQQASFQVADQGGGVASVAVEVDGKVVASSVFGDQAGTCATPYTTPVPCPLQTSGTLSFDTSTIPDGSHALRLLVRDAAGNVTPWGPIMIKTYNTPPDSSCVPSPAVSGAGSLEALTMPTPRRGARHPRAAAVLTVPYGRATEVTGHLRDAAGAPVAGAPLCLVARADGAGGPFTPLARVTTGPDGGYAVPLAAGSSRQILAIDRVGDGAVVGRTLLQVKPAVVAHPHRRVLRNGDVLVIDGHLAGGPFPHRGVALNLQAVRDGRWQGFADAFRTDSRGRFRFRYRFTRTLGVQRYHLRVRAYAQAGYPYVTGYSRRMTIRVVGD